MKKIFLLFLIFLVSSCSFSGSSGELISSENQGTGTIQSDIQTPKIDKNIINVNNIENSIFKIISYTENQKFNYYEQYAYGSAVLIGENELITNAHVVTDENNEVLTNLVACYNSDSSTLPDCKYFTKVEYIDNDNDLAILSIDEKDVNSKDVTFSGGVDFYEDKVSIQDDISIYGFPYIGGDTITFLKGKVSGFTNDGDIKTDAQIDSGNSGGGAFIGDKLVGISSYIITDNNTMGYLKSVSKINDFLNNKDNFIVVNSDISDGFSDYYKKIYTYNNGKGTFEHNGLTLSGIVDDFSLNDLIYTHDYDSLSFIGNNSNNDIYLNIYSTKIVNRNGVSNTDIINGINYYLYDGYNKDCDDTSTIQNNGTFGCIVNYSYYGDDYIDYVKYKIKSDNLYIYSFSSLASNGKDGEYLKSLYSKFDSIITYYNDGSTIKNYIGDFDINSMPNLTKVVLPYFQDKLIYEIVMLDKTNKSLSQNISIYDYDTIKSTILDGSFDYSTYIYGMNLVYAQKGLNSFYSLKTDSNGNDYVYGASEGYYDYQYFSYDGYLYEANFYSEANDTKSKISILNNMRKFSLSEYLKTKKTLSNFDFNQESLKDLDGKWYVYENSLNDGIYDDSGDEYDIASRNTNIEVNNGNIIINNNKSKRHINLAQTIEFKKELLDKGFDVDFSLSNADEETFSVKLIIGKYLENGTIDYENITYYISTNNYGKITTDKIGDLVKKWRINSNYGDDEYPDIVRISIGVNNNTSTSNKIIIKDINIVGFAENYKK